MEEYINLKKEMVEHTSHTTIAGLTEQMLRLEPELQKCDDEMQSFLATNDAALLQEASGVGNYLSALYQQLANAQSEYALLQSMTLDQNLLLEQDRTPAWWAPRRRRNQGTAGGRVGQRRHGRPIRIVCPQHHRHGVSDHQTANPAVAGRTETVWRIPQAEASADGRLGPAD